MRISFAHKHLTQRCLNLAHVGIAPLVTTTVYAISKKNYNLFLSPYDVSTYQQVFFNCYIKFSYFFISFVIRSITDPVDHAEGPHWDHLQHIFYYVDTFNATILRYDPKKRETTTYKIGIKLY